MPRKAFDVEFGQQLEAHYMTLNPKASRTPSNPKPLTLNPKLRNPELTALQPCLLLDSGLAKQTTCNHLD